MKFIFEELISFGKKNCHGEYRILTNPSQILNFKVKNKFFLLTPFLFPDYVLLFPKIEAILTVEGSILSHLAILCREYKIPVLKIKNVLREIPEEGVLTIDYKNKLIKLTNEK